MRAIIFDTETTGLPLFQEPSEDPRQPHIVQLAAAVYCTEQQRVICSMDVIAKPDGWEIPEEVAKIHGITTEHAMQVGIPEWCIVELFMNMWRPTDFRIAHNESFDARIVRIALKRFFDVPMVEEWKAGKTECTQKLATPIVKAPATEKMKRAGRHHHKSANLGEAYKHFTGQELVGAHSALVDVRACLTVWRAIREGSVEITDERAPAPATFVPPKLVPDPQQLDTDNDFPFL